MPWYNKPFVYDHEFEVVFDGFIHQGPNMLQVQVMKEKTNVLGFELYMVKIPGLLDRIIPTAIRMKASSSLPFNMEYCIG